MWILRLTYLAWKSCASHQVIVANFWASQIQVIRKSYIGWCNSYSQVIVILSGISIMQVYYSWMKIICNSFTGHKIVTCSSMQIIEQVFFFHFVWHFNYTSLLFICKSYWSQILVMCLLYTGHLSHMKVMCKSSGHLQVIVID